MLNEVVKKFDDIIGGWDEKGIRYIEWVRQ